MDATSPLSRWIDAWMNGYNEIEMEDGWIQ